MRKSIALNIILILCASTLSGCIWVDDKTDLVTYVEQVQQRPSRKIPALPSFEPYESFYYKGASLRDPFSPLIQFEIDPDDGEEKSDPGNTPPPDTERVKEYLENFKITDLTMVGSIAKNTGQVWALLVDSNGEIHRVTENDFIGLDHGRVTSVNHQILKIQETISNGRGGWIKRPRSIELTEPEGS